MRVEELNTMLRCRLRACLDAESPDERISLLFPPPALCTGMSELDLARTRCSHAFTDNAVMIAWASMHRFLAGDTDEYSIESRPVWSLEDLEKPGPSTTDTARVGNT